MNFKKKILKNRRGGPCRFGKAKLPKLTKQDIWRLNWRKKKKAMNSPKHSTRSCLRILEIHSTKIYQIRSFHPHRFYLCQSLKT